MVVREGTNVTLTCKAKGFPEPYVMWRREDGDEMSISGENGERAKARFPDKALQAISSFDLFYCFSTSSFSMAG
jgi:Immunoglobulin domain